jgi:Domain of unknown function (DUF5615)
MCAESAYNGLSARSDGWSKRSARFYSNENIPLQVVLRLRELGHDVLTSFEAGNANIAMPDEEVLAFASAEGRMLISHNRKHRTSRVRPNGLAEPSRGWRIFGGKVLRVNREP